MNLPEFDPSEFVVSAQRIKAHMGDYAVRPVRWIGWQNRIQSLDALLDTTVIEQRRVAALCGAAVLPFVYGYVVPPLPVYQIPNSNPTRMFYSHKDLPDNAVLAARVPVLTNLEPIKRYRSFRVIAGLERYEFEKAIAEDDTKLRDLRLEQFSQQKVNIGISRLILHDIEPMVRADTGLSQKRKRYF